MYQTLHMYRRSKGVPYVALTRQLVCLCGNMQIVMTHGMTKVNVTFLDKLETCDKTTMQLPKRFITTVPGSSKQRARRSMHAFYK